MTVIAPPSANLIKYSYQRVSRSAEKVGLNNHLIPKRIEVIPNATASQTTNASIVAVRDEIACFLIRTHTVELYAASANAPTIIDRPSAATKGALFSTTVMMGG